MIADIKKWFEKVTLDPSDRNKSVQIGVHFEEIAEMMESLNMPESVAMHRLAMDFKEGKYPMNWSLVNRKGLLDSLCDQVVTVTGVAHMFKLDILEGCSRVNESNWSKFVDSEPIFDENGKVKKGPNYKKPDLDGLY